VRLRIKVGPGNLQVGHYGLRLKRLLILSCQFCAALNNCLASALLIVSPLIELSGSN
jgi:hypothetical protein